MDTLPRFADWRVLNAPALVYGRVVAGDDGRLKVEFRLWDVFAEQQLAGLAYFTAPTNWRRIAHIIADAIYKRHHRRGRLFRHPHRLHRRERPADQAHQAARDHGSGRRQPPLSHRRLGAGADAALLAVAAGDHLSVLSPAAVPRVFIRDIDSNRQEAVGDFPGMTFSPRFSPDGERLVLSLAVDGNTDIYTVDLRTRATRRLTNNAAIDTSPSYAPDGRQIVFNSDRGGSQQLYVMDADGGNVRRISHGQGRYFTPVWSPRGDLIAFTKIARRQVLHRRHAARRRRRADAGGRLPCRRARPGRPTVAC